MGIRNGKDNLQVQFFKTSFFFLSIEHDYETRFYLDY